MAGRRTRSYTAEEGARIVTDIPEDSVVSFFQGEDGDDASDMFEPSSDSDDSDNLAGAIEHEDNLLDQSSDSEGGARRNETTTSSRGRSSGRRRGGEILMRMLLFYFQILEDKMVLSPFKLPSLTHMILLVFYFQKKSLGCFSEIN